MNCYQHPEVGATAFCRDCGRALCTECQHAVGGTIFCQEHLPMSSSAYAAPNPEVANPYQQPVVPVNTSPGLAFVLGLIPGVGAIYNGQYVKGLVHAAIVGLMLSMINGTEGGPIPFLVMIMVCFWAYMAFEAYHTARKRQAGLPVDEWSSLITPNRYVTTCADWANFTDFAGRAVPAGYAARAGVSRIGTLLAGAFDCGRHCHALQPGGRHAQQKRSTARIGAHGVDS